MPERNPNDIPEEINKNFDPTKYDDYNKDESFTPEEVEILDSTPDWYMDLLLKWENISKNKSVFYRMINSKFGVIPPQATLGEFESEKIKHPRQFQMHKRQLELGQSFEAEVISAITRKFVEAGYSEERGQKIAKEYISEISGLAADLTTDAIADVDEEMTKEKIDKSITSLDENLGEDNKSPR